MSSKQSRTNKHREQTVEGIFGQFHGTTSDGEVHVVACHCSVNVTVCVAFRRRGLTLQVDLEQCVCQQPN